MTGTGGITAEGFPPGDLSIDALFARCGGQRAFDEAVFDACTRIQKLDGGLAGGRMAETGTPHGTTGVSPAPPVE